jgi:hypothetical protein
MSIALLIIAGPAFAATYYVSTTGNDTNPGTYSRPWLTIQKAADMARPGDTSIVRSGVYAKPVTFSKSGTVGKPITFKSDSAGTAVIEGSGLNIPIWGSLVQIKGASYLTLSGFEIRNSSFRNICVSGEATHITLQNLHVHHAGSVQIFVDGPRINPAFSVISGCNVHDGPSGGICLYYASGGYWKIQNNEVYNNAGTSNFDGIQVGSPSSASHHIVIKNNTIHDNATAEGGADNLDLGGHAANQHYLVDGNEVYGGGGSFKLHGGANSFHIARFNRFTGVNYVCYNYPNPQVVYNNTFVDTGQSVMFWTESATGAVTLGDTSFNGGDVGRMNWKNDLFFQEAQSSDYILLCSGRGATIDVTYRSVRFQNSLYTFSPGQRMIWGTYALYAGPITPSTFAAFQASNSPDFPDTGSIYSTSANQQMFVDYPARDYHLVSGSTAIDAGTPLTKATNSGRRSQTLKVERASYFHDGYPLNGEYLNTRDSIVIGNNSPALIVSIDYPNNTITLARSLTWNSGDTVTLPYRGTRPDIGAFEF